MSIASRLRGSTMDNSSAREAREHALAFAGLETVHGIACYAEVK
jgi:hypothetical protein